MALSQPTTPKTQFVTPKKIRTMRSTENLENIGTRTTPRSQFATPKSCKAIGSVASTPECFNPVTIETPNCAVVKRRSDKETLDTISNLTVAVRIRPMNSRELACVGAADVVRVKNQELTIRSNTVGNSVTTFDHVFQYDHIFWSCDETKSLYANQKDVFVTIGKPLLNSAFRGYNACLFAYGQTGSGKSFSMMGPNSCEIADIESEEFSGITPRFCRELFERVSKFGPDSTVSVEVSYFEIYNEKIHDLLATSNMVNKMPLKVREHPEWGPYVVDLSIHVVKSYAELRNWLLLGNKNRATAATTMNEKSSRSHSIFSIELSLTESLDESDSDTSRRSKVSLVDLAGSERIGASHNSEEKIRQGVSINKSLLTLGKVISSLADQKKNQFVPYRDSVLTWLLKESLGGNSLTCMLATITPANTNLDETLATLRYACQARTIVNRARINENPHDRLIRELKSEVQRLKALKQDYERNSILNSSLTTMNNSSNEEMEELRNKLLSAEEKLQVAENNWKRRFMESAALQLKELAESEKRREELESKIRIMNCVDTNINVSLYKTNFLEELEDVLTDEAISEQVARDKIMEWCSQNHFKCSLTNCALIIVDSINQKETSIILQDVKKLHSFENIADFVNSLTWTEIKKHCRKLSKSEVMSSLDQIYQILTSLQPSETDNNLNLLFARVNKSLQAFEAALLHNVSKTNGQKSVTFNV